MTAPVRVVKLGGSLLDWPELAAGFRAWLARQPAVATVVIVGGGEFVESLRRLDRAEPLPPATIHWLAVRAMSLTAAIFAERVPEATLAESLEQLRLADTQSPQIFDVEMFLRVDRGTPLALPESWDVTSDSIAARVAQILNANELVLLKSALPQGAANRETLARSGYVDAYFPRAASGLSVRVVNLRDPDLPPITVD